MDRRALVLLSNDDGHSAPNLLAMRAALLAFADVVVCAPELNQSATSHSLSLHRSLRLREVGDAVFSLDGTPADCVYVALNAGTRILPRRPDLTVSGLNHGLNLGIDVFYSGTVAAAREAAMHGVPAIAASLDIAGHPNYGPAAAATARVVEIVKNGGLPKGVFLNVNVPAGAELKGLRLARQSSQMGTERFEETKTPYGRRMFWSFFEQPTTAEPGTDVQAALDGYVAVTPLQASEFSADAFERLKGRIR
jgi:5'-nucleotidase